MTKYDVIYASPPFNDDLDISHGMYRTEPMRAFEVWPKYILADNSISKAEHKQDMLDVTGEILAIVFAETGTSDLIDRIKLIRRNI